MGEGFALRLGYLIVDKVSISGLLNRIMANMLLPDCSFEGKKPSLVAYFNRDFLEIVMTDSVFTVFQ